MPLRFRLHQLLEAANLTQHDLRIRSGLSPTTIRAVHSNRAKQISLKTLDRICAALKVELSDLIEHTDLLGRPISRAPIQSPSTQSET